MDLRDPDPTNNRSDAEPLLGLAHPGGSDAALIRSTTPPSVECADPTRPDAASVPSGIDALLISRDRSESTVCAHKETSVKWRNPLKKSKYLHGWRMGITLCAATAVTVFMINLSLTIWAILRYSLKKGGLGTIQEGSCKETARLSLVLHLVMNILSTLLLGASNYSMQCLASPTREEVDRAHHQKKWLDIGIPSVRNLTRIARHRMVLWWLLAISSLPLHLFYNSAVFSTLSSQEYTVYVASPHLVDGIVSNWSAPVEHYIYGADENLTLAHFRDIGNTSIWQQLNNAACIRAYSEEFVSAHGDVLAISAAVSADVLIYPITDERTNNNAWICSSYQFDVFHHLYPLETCGIDYISKNTPFLKNTSSWYLKYSLSGSDETHKLFVEYCLSERLEEHCQIKFSIIIMGIVMACNLAKAICMLLALRRHTSRTLVTLGDAIEEFLVKPDATTRLACLSSRHSFSGGRWGDAPSTWEAKGHRWFSSLSTQRWLVCNIL